MSERKWKNENFLFFSLVDILWFFCALFPYFQESLRNRRLQTQRGCQFWTRKFQNLVLAHVWMTLQASLIQYSTSFAHIPWWTRLLITNTTILSFTNVTWCSRSSSLTSKCFYKKMMGKCSWKCWKILHPGMKFIEKIQMSLKHSNNWKLWKLIHKSH